MTAGATPEPTAVETSLARVFAGAANGACAELVFWIGAFLVLLVLPSRDLLLNEIAILALFALSLDLLLGYAGIISLGHAAFFGIGAYVAGLLTKHGLPDPTLGLVIAAVAPPFSASRRASSCFAARISRASW